MNRFAALMFAFVLGLQLNSGALGFAQEGLQKEPPSGMVAAPPFKTLPVRDAVKIDAEKWALAQGLSAWVVKTLEEQHASVGVIARQGPPLTVLVDKSGMTHSGLVFRHPETREWMVYSLYSDPATQAKTALLWRQSIEDFFYGQRTKKWEALLLLPSAALQTKLLAQLYQQPFETLLPSDHHYNLVAPVDSPTSFNCTKWILLHVYAAREGTSDLSYLLPLAAHEPTIATVKPNYVTRIFLKRKPDVLWDELNPPNQVHTVTVDGLSRSPLFEKRFLYSQRFR